MIENLSSKIDTLSGRAPGTTVSETTEIKLEIMASTSRLAEVNELTQSWRSLQNQKQKCMEVFNKNFEIQ